MNEEVKKYLLNYFKKLNREERVDYLCDILENNINDDYLSKYDYAIISSSFESLLIDVTHIAEDGIQNGDDVKEVIRKFVFGVSEFSYDKVEVKKIKPNNKESKKALGKIASFLVAVVMASNMASMLVKMGKDKSADDNKKLRATQITTSATDYDINLAEGVNFVEIVSGVAEGSLTLEEAATEYNLTDEAMVTIEHVIESINSNTSEESYTTLSENNKSESIKEVKTQYVEEIIYENVSENNVLSNEDKLAVILREYNLTKDQFDILAAVVMGESKNGDYNDAYAVINTIYNRAYINHKWQKAVSNEYGEEYAKNMYYQVILPDQFTALSNNRYLQFFLVTDSDSYQAIIDFLYGMIEAKGDLDAIMNVYMHPYGSFRSNETDLEDYTTVSVGGNKFISPVSSDDFINWLLDYMNIDANTLYTWLAINNTNLEEVIAWVEDSVPNAESSLSR